LRVSALDPARSQVDLAGRYRPPLGRAGHALDDVLLARVAHSTVRSLLRRLAHDLEEESVQRSVGSNNESSLDVEHQRVTGPITLSSEDPPTPPVVNSHV
jgi:hypothetical protein